MIVSFATTIIVITLLLKVALLPLLWAIPIAVFVFLILLLLKRSWKINVEDVAKFLNRCYPQLQESTHLVLTDYKQLNFLQKLQVQKVEEQLLILNTPKEFNKPIVNSIFIFLIAIVISGIVSWLPVSIHQDSTTEKAGFTSGSTPLVLEKIFPEIKSVNLQINPPAYIRKSNREQSKLDLVVEEGSNVIWHLKTNIAIKNISLIFNDKQVLLLHPENNDRNSWSARKAIDHAGFYQVAIDNKISPFYKMEIIKDSPPVINIQSPKPATVIDFGRPEKVNLLVALSDDYGVADATIFATISSGSGEAVKFKEQQLSFTDFIKGSLKCNVKKLLDLKALGMNAGDELYFYVSAKDNHNQEKRSDVYRVSIADTTQLMSMDGLVSGIDLKPEYFRSERQIIIETEQLLKSKDTLQTQQFNNTSNNLGIDQKLLRLRYGKFLGEENETEIGEHGKDGGTENAAADFGNAEKIKDEYTHKHDNAEDASFFEPGLKAQLKATLSEMWKAELQLRLNKPADALPFEYKALRLLKDLQQKSRVYVAKTGFKSTPLKPEKRLTGDLSKIAQPIQRQVVESKKDLFEVTRKAAGLLGILKTGKSISDGSVATLREASLQLYNKAAQQPSVFLPAVTSMNRILSAVAKQQTPRMADINLVENGVQKLLAVQVKLPARLQGGTSDNLSNNYFKNLNRSKAH